MRSSSGVALSVALLACLSPYCQSRKAGELEVYHGVSNYSFPDNFMFGVASAAYQIEGAWNEDGRGPSMWDSFLHNNLDYTPDHSNGDEAADSYHFYKEDVQMVKNLGLKYYRFSISWPRILPHGTDNYINKKGVNYYLNLINVLQSNGITPVVTLFHWDMPEVFMDLGGWTNPNLVDYFEDYARIAFKLFGDKVKIWTTMNEPHIHCYNGYDGDYFAPALSSHGVGVYLCSHYILLAHARVYHLYDKVFRPKQKGIIGITMDAFWAEPKDSNNEQDRIAAERYLQMHLGLYAHPIFTETGDYPALVRMRVNNISRHQGYIRSRLPYFSKEEIEAVRGSSDFFGLNHYTTFLMSSSSWESNWNVPSVDHDTGVLMEQHPLWPRPGAEWLTVYPTGFRKLINWITNNYRGINGTKVPIIITENGMSDFGGIEDYARVSYYNKYLYQLLLAIHEDQCDVKGYFAWTLMDDFEWKDGYISKFGLYSVDFNSPKKTRIPKLSAYNYKEIVSTRRINFDLMKKIKANPKKFSINNL